MKYFFFILFFLFSFFQSAFASEIEIFCIQTTAPAGTVFHFADHLGSSSIDTDTNGNIVSKTEYYPFGEEKIPPAPFIKGEYKNPYKYTGKELDEEIGMYYYEARYYDPILKRFSSVDPWSGDLLDPQSLNKYSYVRNNPIRYIDPSGECFGSWADSGFCQAAAGITVGTGETFQSVGNVIVHPVDTFNSAVDGVKKTGGEMKEFGKDLVLHPINTTKAIAGEAKAHIQDFSNASIFDQFQEGTKIGIILIPAAKGIKALNALEKVASVPKNISGITGYTNHGLNQKINRGVKSSDILDTMKNPLQVKDIVIDSQGRSSQRFIGNKAEVVINPNSGQTISVNPTSTKKADKLNKK